MHKTITIIGAGQVGSRHLQSLALLSKPCRVYIVDPSSESLKLARERYQTIEQNVHHELNYTTSLNELPSKLDLAIISTCSKDRLSILKTLLKNTKVDNIIFEKVLFPLLADYKIASRLLSKNKVKAWVNLISRTWPIYQELGKIIRENNRPIDLYVNGSDLGLGCNSIHYIDLLSFLSGSTRYSLNISELDPGHISSKRPGYLEFTGTLTGKFAGGASFSLTSYLTPSIQQTTVISSSQIKCIILENTQQAFVSTPLDPTWRPFPYNPPLLSQYAYKAVEQILDKGNCLLPTFAQAASLHIPLLKGFLLHLGRKDTGLCPIT